MSKKEDGNRGLYLDHLHSGREPMKVVPTPKTPSAPIPVQEVPLQEGREPMKAVPTPPCAPASKPNQAAPAQAPVAPKSKKS